MESLEAPSLSWELTESDGQARSRDTLLGCAAREAPASAAGFAQAGKNERSGVLKRIREMLIELGGGRGICEPA